MKPIGNGRPAWSRRDVVRTLAGAAGYPLLASAQGRPRIGIIGGGMAGMSLAWLLDGAFDVVLLEARDSLGGNIRAVPVELDGYQFEVDLGAQYFHPGPYPTYVTLLEQLGLYPTPAETHSFPASITLATATGQQLLFVSPILPGRIWPILASWNRAGVEAFNTAFQAAKQREQQNGSWATTLEDWLPTLGLTREQWEGMILPWAASLYSGSVTEARGLSARAAMIFVAKALPDQLTDPLLYSVLVKGLLEPLRRMTAQLTTAQIHLQAPVSAITPQQAGGFLIEAAGGRSELVDQVVFACSGPATRQLLNGIPGTGAQRQALSGIAFTEARLALHTDPLYAPANAQLRSFFNATIQGGSCEASMWMADVLTSVPPATASKLWKSWVGRRQQQPQNVIAEAGYRHMSPTPATIAAQQSLLGLQGQSGLWFAGGYTRPYDSQETALLSALEVARGLAPPSPRMRLLTP